MRIDNKKSRELLQRLPTMHAQYKGRLTEARTSAGSVSDYFVEILTAHSPCSSLVVVVNFLLDQFWVFLVVCLLKSIVWEDSVTMLACRLYLVAIS